MQRKIGKYPFFFIIPETNKFLLKSASDAPRKFSTTYKIEEITNRRLDISKHVLQSFSPKWN